MKIRTRAVDRLLHVSLRWACVLLTAFLADACKPRDLVCDRASYFQVLQPEEGAGVAPFSIERLGPKLRDIDLPKVPGVLELHINNRVRVGWESDDFARDSDLIFSPSEGVARNVKDPIEVYPMRHFSDGASERVRLGFRSPSCRVPREFGYCPTKDDDLFLVAELICHPEQENRFSR